MTLSSGQSPFLFFIYSKLIKNVPKGLTHHDGVAGQTVIFTTLRSGLVDFRKSLTPPDGAAGLTATSKILPPPRDLTPPDGEEAQMDISMILLRSRFCFSSH